jgi:apolipoprotein N-acyltransferase
LKARYAYPLLLLSGVALSFAFPEPDITPLAWVACVPFFVCARGRGARSGFWLAYTFGVGFFGALLTWVSLIGWVAWLVLVLLQAAYLGGFGLTWCLATRRSNAVVRVCAAGALWVVFEFLRSIFPVGGFTWGQLAQSQHDLLWMLRPAALGGGWLVSFLLVAINACLAEAIVALSRREVRRAVLPAIAGGALVLAPLALPAQDATGPEIEVAIAQGNVPREIPIGPARDLAILESHRVLTEELAGQGLDLVVWPESALALDVESSVEADTALATAAQTVNAPVIAGGNLDVDAEHYRVMAFHAAPDGGIVDRYQKTHLVPFGEYVPARSLFDWIPMLDQVEKDAIPGERVEVFDVAGGPVAPVISFEGDFGSLVRRRMDEGGRLLTVLTNTSTWGDSWASAQHVAFSQVRAAENGVWVVHAAISGISAFIQPDGRVVERTPLWTATSATHKVAFAEDITFYARVGDWVPLLSALFAAAALGWATRRRKGSEE